MPRALSSSEFRSLLNNPEVSDSQIAEYLVPKPGAGAQPFNPVLVPNPELVDTGELESALEFGNTTSRWRRRLRFNWRQSTGADLPVIVSEGDSWFQFPFIINDIIDHLDDDYLIWSCGAAGDSANDIVQEKDYLEGLIEQQDTVSAFLLSAAGNDVLGQDHNGNSMLLRLLHRKTSSRTAASQLVNQSALKTTLAKLEDQYRRILSTIREDQRFETLPILIHGYDYARPYPNGPRDPRRPFWADRDEWLGQPMSEKEIEDPKLRKDIIVILIDELHDMLSRLAAEDTHLHLVDLRGEATATRDWADEIHPTSKTFGQLAQKFDHVLQKVAKPRPRPEAVKVESAMTRSDDRLKLKTPGLFITERSIPEIEPGHLGFGNPQKFARGFRRTAQEIAHSAHPEAAIEDDDSLPFRFLTKGAERGRAVCKIKCKGTNYAGQTGNWFGTGFLIAPNILLTNYHVINSADVARRSRALFGYDERENGEIGATSSFKLNPDRLLIASPWQELDYCFVWVEGTPHETYGTIDFWRGSFMAPERSKANIIHHPDGNPKRASLEKNEVIDLGLREVLCHYASDTEPGSSGGPVMTDEWRLFALHHASTQDLSADLQKKIKAFGHVSEYLNEGIKTSAIAIDIDRRANLGPNAAMARQVQSHFKGSDSRTGFFGTLGRSVEDGNGMEIVVDTYRGAPGDIDVAFWNIEWFNQHYEEKLPDVARIIADLNLDIWAFEETSFQATEALADVMRREFDLDFDVAASEPIASPSKQTTCVMWNRRTVVGQRLDWPDEIDKILRLRSDDPNAARFEATEGRIFNRYPGLFRFRALNLSPDQKPFDFNLVPVHLKAMAEGAKRRRMAANVLARAVEMSVGTAVADNDWIIGGDFNAELATGQFDGLRRTGFTPMSAADEQAGAITYLSRRYQSLIDSIFLSPGLTPRADAADFMIIAPDRNDPGFIERVSDHRPVMIRLSISENPKGNGDTDPEPDGSEDKLLRRFLDELRDDPAGTLSELSDILRKS